MAEAATSPELKEAFHLHLAQTQGQIKRLEQVFEMMGEQAERKTCKATAGLIAEGKENIAEIEKGPVLDAALIGAAQKVEHYEIASYGTARTFAETMGHAEIAELLQMTLDEEEDTDEKLTELAESIINQRAA